MVTPSHSIKKSTKPSAATANDADFVKLEGAEKLGYTKPVLNRLGRIDQLTLGSGGSCTDGVQNDKALTGSGKCP